MSGAALLARPLFGLISADALLATEAGLGVVDTLPSIRGVPSAVARGGEMTLAPVPLRKRLDLVCFGAVAGAWRLAILVRRACVLPEEAPIDPNRAALSAVV